ncbi:MAG: serine--tRNA ligase [Candidatus Omnitrophica bacterium]|nr:serine--tRNA ligase [Candidatus Omnitrophota bacterium]
MLDLKTIRNNPDIVKKALKDRSLSLDIDSLLALDEKRREAITEVEQLKATKNKTTDEIAQLKLNKEDANAQIESTKLLSQKIGEIDKKVVEYDTIIAEIVLNIPNIPDSSVPVGTPEKNEIVRAWGKPKNFNFKPRNHIELAEAHRLVDFERAAKIAGSNFVSYRGKGALLERALINFMLDLHVKKHGYTEIFPPFLVNRKSMTGTGQLPKLEEDMYRLKDDDFFLIPTAEVPVTNLHAQEVLEEDDLPIYYTAYTACFRREAGSYGKDTRGLIRVHQFDKVEMVKFVKPEASYDELETLLGNAEEVLQLLGLPYRILKLATGDLSFAASKCYDIEVWAPGSEKWLEVSSCSNFENFQARRANIRFKSKATGKTELVHTLNGSGVALARTVIAILENYQNQDGSIAIPDVLVKYMDGLKVIEEET